MKVAVIGTVGVPSNYGGFETLVENIIGDNCSDGIDYIIYCSSSNYKKKQSFYKGARLIYVPLKANGMQSTLYDVYSMLHAIFVADVLLILGVSGCLFLPFLRVVFRKKIIVNIDGLEHRRQKWGKFTKWFLKTSEAFAVRFSDVIVADNKAIQTYVEQEYTKPSVLIEYGGDHVICDTLKIEDNVLLEYNLKKSDYSFSVCRIEPENNIHLILGAFSKSKHVLVIVGNWEKSEYGKNLLIQYAPYSNIKMINPIYQLEILNVLRSNAGFYIHGHSAGGTNPSLVEAMYFGRPIFAYDVIYNIETTENKANYFKTESDLYSLINNSSELYHSTGELMREIAIRRYKWKVIAEKYEQIYRY